MSSTESVWNRLRSGLARTQERLAERLGAALDLPARLDDATAADLEEALIAADLGVETTRVLIGRLRDRLRRSDVGRQERLREMLAEEILALLAEAPPPPRSAGRGSPSSSASTAPARRPRSPSWPGATRRPAGR